LERQGDDGQARGSAAAILRLQAGDHIPAAHLLRGIDRFLDLSSLRAELTPFYSTIGRPSIDPDLMIRMLVIGYYMGI
jgi:transposase